MNKVIEMGRITADPVLKTLPSGKQVTNFSIAVPRRFAREGQQQADFFNCQAWEKTATFICNYFSKGSMIAIEGRLQTSTYEDNSGKRQSKTEIIVENVFFTGEKAQTADSGYQSMPNYDNNYQEMPDYSDSDLPF